MSSGYYKYVYQKKVFSPTLVLGPRDIFPKDKTLRSMPNNDAILL